MKSKKRSRLENLVRAIQYYEDMTLEAIAQEIDYTRSHFTRVVNSGEDNEAIYSLLNEAFPKIEQKVLSEEIEKSGSIAERIKGKPTLSGIRDVLAEIITAIDRVGVTEQIGLSSKTSGQVSQVSSAKGKVSDGPVAKIGLDKKGKGSEKSRGQQKNSVES